MSALGLFLAASAAAGPSNCTPGLEVRSRVVYCFENKLFVAAADECLEKFDAEVAARSVALSGAFADTAGRSASAQQSKMANTDTDFSGTSASLGTLLDVAARARGELVAYTRNLIYVNDASPAFIDYFGLLADHQQDPCFHDNYQALLDRIAKLDHRIADLRRTNEQVLAMAGVIGARRGNLELGGGAALVKGGIGQGAGKSGANRNPASTITGAIQDPKPPQ
jgi:hypothetical protein